MPTKCTQCGSENVCSGYMAGEYLRFRPDNMKFLTASMGASAKAYACLECGVLHFQVAPAEVRAIMRGEKNV